MIPAAQPLIDRSVATASPAGRRAPPLFEVARGSAGSALDERRCAGVLIVNAHEPLGAPIGACSWFSTETSFVRTSRTTVTNCGSSRAFVFCNRLRPAASSIQPRCAARWSGPSVPVARHPALLFAALRLPRSSLARLQHRYRGQTDRLSLPVTETFDQERMEAARLLHENCRPAEISPAPALSPVCRVLGAQAEAGRRKWSAPLERDRGSCRSRRPGCDGATAEVQQRSQHGRIFSTTATSASRSRLNRRRSPRSSRKLSVRRSSRPRASPTWRCGPSSAVTLGHGVLDDVGGRSPGEYLPISGLRDPACSRRRP